MKQEQRPIVEIGDIVAGKYRIDRVLGVGGMGVVVAATHSELQQTRAIKFMLPETMSDRENVERFLREARAAARLQSQHAVKIHDVSRLPTGELYIVMEYLEGIDLKEHLRNKRVLPVPEAALYMTQACEAIAEAHAAGIVHRDLKPANLFLAERADGARCLKVLDFGIAKLSDGLTGEGGHLTTSQVIIGSPLYMSPEQIISTRSVDGRSDIWSLGVILYTMVTGEMPFRGATANVIFAAVQRDPPVPPLACNPTLPTELERIILRCLEKDPALRFATAGELGRALAPFAPAAGRLPPASAEVASETGAATLLWNRSSSQQASRTVATAVLQDQSQGSFQPPTPFPFSPRPASPSYSQSGSQSHPHAAAAQPPSSSQSFQQYGGQTSSPVVSPFEPPPRSRARELLVAAGGFSAALLIVGVIMFLSRGSDHPSSPQATALPALSESSQALPAPPSAAAQPTVSPSPPASESATAEAEAPAAPAVKPKPAPVRTAPRSTASAQPSKPVATTPPPTMGAPLKQRQ